MNPTRLTPTRPHPNPAGTTSEQVASTDQRGGVKPNPAASAQNIVQLPAPGWRLRAASPNAMWTQTAAELLALGRTLRAASPNPRARFAPIRRPGLTGLRILDYQPHATGGEERI